MGWVGWIIKKNWKEQDSKNLSLLSWKSMWWVQSWFKKSVRHSRNVVWKWTGRKLLVLNSLLQGPPPVFAVMRNVRQLTVSMFVANGFHHPAPAFLSASCRGVSLKINEGRRLRCVTRRAKNRWTREPSSPNGGGFHASIQCFVLTSNKTELVNAEGRCSARSLPPSFSPGDLREKGQRTVTAAAFRLLSWQLLTSLRSPTVVVFCCYRTGCLTSMFFRWRSPKSHICKQINKNMWRNEMRWKLFSVLKWQRKWS